MIDHIKKGTSEIKKEIRKKTLSYVLAGFALVGGLAWNDAIRALIAELFPNSTDTVIAKFIFAIVLTMVIVLISMQLSRLMKEEEE